MKANLTDLLFVSEPNDITDPGLYIKPIPGQVVAIIEPGPLQHQYAAMFAAAPAVLQALHFCLEYLEANDGEYGVRKRINAAENALAITDAALERLAETEAWRSKSS